MTTTPPKILITGGSGFGGWNLIQMMSESNEEDYSLGLIFNQTPLSFEDMVQFQCDLSDPELVNKIVEDFQPRAVIHCAALSNSKQCEEDPDFARKCNVDSTKNLLKACGSDTRFIFLSTDLVFDGQGQNYNESDEPNPKNVYAQTKVEAEQVIAEHSNNAVILRTSLVYGPDAPHYSCFLNWMHEACKANEPLTLFTDEYRTPILIQDLGHLVMQLIDSDYKGVLNAAGPERLSRHEMGQKFCDVYGYSGSNVEAKKLAEVKTAIHRPADVSLDISLAQEKFDYNPSDFENGLKRIKEIVEAG